MPAVDITREVFWNIPGWAIVTFYLVAALAIATLAWLFWTRHVRIWLAGRYTVELVDLSERIRSFLTFGLGQRKVVAEPSAALMHTLIYVGFIMLFIATCVVFIEEDTPLKPMHGIGFILLEVWGDTGGVIFLTGLALAAYRRFRIRPAQLSRRPDDALVLALFAAIAVTGFLVEAARITADPKPWFIAGYVGWLLAQIFGLLGHGEGWRTVHQFLWAFHFALVVVFFVSLPLTKLAHMVTSPTNTFFRTVRRGGALEPSFAMALATPTDGGHFTDLRWKQLMDYSACTRCGRCEAVCPAHLSGKPLSPKEVVLKMGDEARQRGLQGLLATTVPFSVTPDELWACTSCRACVEVCPVFINQLDTIVDLRRNLVEAGQVPGSIAQALEGLQRYGNPWGRPPSTRADWTRGLDVPTVEENPNFEVLYWVGCAGAYDQTGQDVARAVVKVLKAAGVNFAILANKERCTGDPARRIGEEGLFQLLAKQNVSTLNQHGVRTILTHCPHCLNTLKNEYPAFGGQYEVIHHSQYLNRLIAEGKLVPGKKIETKVTYHDPCYLGRHNGEYDAPRAVVRQLTVGEVVEMARAREKALCCGGGGGQIWMDQNIGERINYIRFDEAAATGAAVIATACPFCKVMLDSSAEFRGMKERVKVKDIAQIIDESL